MVNITKTSTGGQSLVFTNTDSQPTVDIVRLNITAGSSIIAALGGYCSVYNTLPYVTTATNIVYTCPTLPASDYYLLRISRPNSPSDDTGNTPLPLEYFQLTATSYLTASGGPYNSSAIISTLVKATDTFRDRVAKLISLNQL